MMNAALQTWTGLTVLIMHVVRYACLNFAFPRSFGCWPGAASFTLNISPCYHLEQIRAGHLSGDCHYKREFLRGFMKIRGHEQVSFLPSEHLVIYSQSN